MFATVEDVKGMTGYTVTGAQLSQAQILIEAYVGRSEYDINDPTDFELLRRATAFQAAYMSADYQKVYEQMKVAQQGVAGNLVTFRNGDHASPYIAGTAQLILRNLSWFKSRSIHTGRIFQRDAVLDWSRN